LNKPLKNISLYFIGQIFPKIGGILLLPIYTMYLNPEEFGIINLMISFEFVLIIFFTLALDRSIVRLYWDYPNEKERKIFIGSLILVVFFIGLSMLSVLFCLKNYLLLIFKSVEFYPYFMYAIITALFKSYTLIPKSVIVVEKKASLHSRLTIFQYIINTILTIYFLVLNGEGASGYLKGSLFSVILIFPIYIYLFKNSFIFKLNIKMIRKAFSYSIPFIPTVFMFRALDLSDRVFIEKFLTLNDVGIYGFSYTISGILIYLASAFSLALEPEYFRLANFKKKYIKKIYNLNRVNINGIIFISFLTIFLSKEAIELFFNEGYKKSVDIIPFIIISLLLAELNVIVNGRVFRQSKMMKVDMYFSFLTVFFQILFYFVLIPRFGLFGLLYAKVISSFISFFSRFSFTVRSKNFIKIKVGEIIKNIVFSLMLILLFDFFLEIEFYFKLFLKMIISFFLIIWFYIKNKSSIKSLFLDKLN
jgi:O-antigen/teichoic acid export membrane protein